MRYLPAILTVISIFIYRKYSIDNEERKRIQEYKFRNIFKTRM